MPGPLALRAVRVNCLQTTGQEGLGIAKYENNPQVVNMTEQELKVKECELNLLEQKAKVRNAQRESEAKYAEAKFELEKERIALEREEARLQRALTELANPFESGKNEN